MRAAFEETEVRDLSPLVELLDETPGRSRPARSSDPVVLLSMPGYDYGWISLDARRIGFDFYFRDDDPESVREYILTDIAPRGTGQPGLTDYPFEAAARAGHCWTMRMQATQPLAARLLAGFAATALASLTAGFLWSADSGADHHRMPASPDLPRLVPRMAHRADGQIAPTDRQGASRGVAPVLSVCGPTAADLWCTYGVPRTDLRSARL